MIIAIDPGDKKSAVVLYAPARGAILEAWDETNPLVCTWLRGVAQRKSTLVIEGIASYGMPVGEEVFNTCIWIGRFIESWRGEFHLLYRKEIKLHLCGSARAKDANVRAALLDKFGGGKAARGTKKSPGVLYGISGVDKWAALSVAVTWAETHQCTDPSAGAAA